jgi:xanthine dehydrogenase YagR molybdenum-binding subunit
MTANSVAPAVQAAAKAARDKLIDTAIGDRDCALFGARQDDVVAENGWLYLRSNTARRELFGAVIARHGDAIEARGNAKPGPEREQYSMHSFGAVFAEVRVDPEIGRIRVPRIVGTYGVGTLLNTKTARSQLIGGIVWGVSLALFEETHFDLRNGHPINGNLAEYHVPVNADIGSIDVLFVDEHDPYVNSLGTKGIGEIGITGVAAALANAVYHATGRRVRDVPITLDKLL